MATREIRLPSVKGLNSYELAVKSGTFTGTLIEYLNKEQQYYNDMVIYGDALKDELGGIDTETLNELMADAVRYEEFATYADMEVWLSDEANAGTLKSGDLLLIDDMDVPNYWVIDTLEVADENTGYYYQIAELGDLFGEGSTEIDTSKLVSLDAVPDNRVITNAVDLNDYLEVGHHAISVDIVDQILNKPEGASAGDLFVKCTIDDNVDTGELHRQQVYMTYDNTGIYTRYIHRDIADSETVYGEWKKFVTEDELGNLPKCEDITMLNQSLGFVHKNLLKCSRTGGGTSYSIAYELNSDKSITLVNGTATANANVTYGSADLKKGVTYVLNGCPSGGSEDTYKMSIYYGSTVCGVDYGEGAIYTPEEDKTVTVKINVMKGVTVENLTFYPMIRNIISDDAYEPYAGDVVHQLDELSDNMANYLPLTGGIVKGDATINNISFFNTTCPSSNVPKYLLMFDVTTWYTEVSISATSLFRKFVGQVFVSTNKNGDRMTYSNIITIYTAVASSRLMYDGITTDNGEQLWLRTSDESCTPVIIHNTGTNTYHLALRVSAQYKSASLSLVGQVVGTIDGTWITCKDSDGTMPTNYEVSIDSPIYLLERAAEDAEGNNIADTYATKTALSTVKNKINSEIATNLNVKVTEFDESSATLYLSPVVIEQEPEELVTEEEPIIE